MTYLNPVLPVLLALAAVAHWARWRRGVTVALALLAITSWPPAAYVMTLPLTWGLSEEIGAGVNAEAMVVLAGHVRTPLDEKRPPEVGDDTARRIQTAARLYREWRAAPVIAAGGRLAGAREAYAVTMKRALEKEGIPEEAIELETASRNTYENAVRTAELARRRGIRSVVVVTDAYHLRRAVWCFRKQGLAAVGVSAGPEPFRFEWVTLLPSWTAMRLTEQVLHEYVAIGVYWYRGWL